MSDGLRLTDTQRRAAIERIDENIALRSGAGCGKTFVLARRYTELLLVGEDEEKMQRLVALTFTDKAAVEMSQRVRRMLLERAGKATGAQRQRLLRWVDELPSARISTIHSFCSGILRSHAVEAGVDPAFAVATDDTFVNRLVEEAVDQAVLSGVESERPGLDRLLGELRFTQICELTVQLVRQRLDWRPERLGDPQAVGRQWEELSDRERQAAWRRLEADTQLAEELDRLLAVPCYAAEDELHAWRVEKLALAQRLLEDPRARTPEAFRLLTETPGRRGKDANWGEKGSATRMRHALKDVLDRLCEYAIYAEQPNDLDAEAAEIVCGLSRLATDAIELYGREKRRRGMLDFTDLLHLTGELLREQPEIRRRIGSQIDQLLIDECQDTDAFQAMLLVAQLLSDGTDRPPEPGRLFLVGDVKQSIYRFRGAQVDIFRRLCNMLGEPQAESLDLSFRTHCAGVGFVNHLFGEMMGEEYDAIQAFRHQPPPQPSVEILLARPAKDPGNGKLDAEQVIQLQAALTAQRIHEMLEKREPVVWDGQADRYRAVRPGDIAILFGRMTQSLPFERQLALRGVPYYVVAGTGFFRQQEVFDILNALKA
ncbi:MAG: UvrD-helicase domain-containing protein, partial [Planctomycetota bacterium]